MYVGIATTSLPCKHLFAMNEYKLTYIKQCKCSLVQTSTLETSQRSCDQSAVISSPSSASTVDGGIPACAYVLVSLCNAIWYPTVGECHHFIVCLTLRRTGDHTNYRGDHFSPHCLIGYSSAEVSTLLSLEEIIAVINRHL